MRFDQLLIGFLLLAVFVVGGTMMLNDINENYGAEAAAEGGFPDGYEAVNLSDDDFGGVYDKIDEIYGITNDAKNHTLYDDIEGGSDSWESMTKGSYSALRLVSGTVPLFFNITTTVATKIGVPPFLVNVAYIAFLITIIFGIIYMIFRFKD